VTDAPLLQVPDGFGFGASSAAVQIEGAVAEDGRGESIWDRFCRVPGAIAGGASGEVARDHYEHGRGAGRRVARRLSAAPT
jgi:beta-glucosidase